MREVEDELARDKGAYEETLSQPTSKLGKVKAEFSKTQGDLELARQQAVAASERVKATRQEIE